MTVFFSFNKLPQKEGVFLKGKKYKYKQIQGKEKRKRQQHLTRNAQQL